ELSCIHDTFHVSNLKKSLAEPDVQVPLEEIEIDENLRFVEEPIEIVERDVKKLKRRRIPLVKITRQDDSQIIEALQADCNVKTTNIILQGLPLEVYALVSTHKGDDPIDAINHMMSFLTAVVTLRYLATNNQLRTSSNPRQQATINNGRVTIQPIQERQNFVSASSSRPFTSGLGGAPGKQRVIVCYNCKGEGHMSKQCTKPKRKRDAEWFKDKVLLVQAQANGQVL
nr:reverse transcriptase domain-containing protein [Tanacetum cinerariifolium]GEZ93985.1 reverse transcriptase domain-containing protein [Tanacetum cinerariifolium]